MVENVPAPKQFTYAIDETKCRNCVLWETSTSGHVRRSAVYGRGSGSSGLWIYGEDLRAEDVKQGLPIVGDAGKLLSRLLNEVGLSEERCFITNVVRCRPPHDRATYAVEYKACMETHSKLDQPVTERLTDGFVNIYWPVKGAGSFSTMNLPGSFLMKTVKANRHHPKNWLPQC
jgi:hypothetical protein